MVEPEGGIARRFAKPLSFFVAVVLCGALGYWALEKMSFLDALYMAVITVTTVGFGEVRPLDAPGRVFTIILVLFGVGAFTYCATTVANYLIAGEIKGFLTRRKMEQQIRQLDNHFIVCGYGRMGTEVAREFRRQSQPLVVIEQDRAAADRAVQAGHLTLHGDAQNDEVLRTAGVQRARGLVAVLDTDAANLMVTLSARTLSEKLFIVSRVNSEASESKLIAAGANRVLFPHGLGGRRIAQMALRPNVVEFLEVVMHDEELELWLEELPVGIESPLDGRAIGSANIRGATGANIVALRQRTGKLTVAPLPETVVQAGDILIALGTRAQLSALRELTR